VKTHSGRNAKATHDTRTEYSREHSFLYQRHLDLIKQSSISAEISRERGYRTEERRKNLLSHGFRHDQCRTPGLLIPLYNVRGKAAGYQFRPDRPRERTSKPIKYETPHGQRALIDCPPRCQPALADPKVPLWITEGVRKADAAATAGLCCIDLLGVWNWRGTNEQGGKTALADWELIALNVREVFIAFDSDVTQKREVRAALDRLKTFLEARGARVRIVRLPAGDDGTKVGLDDFLAAGHSVEELSALAADEIAATAMPAAEKKWPTLDDRAYCGMAGDLVRMVAPRTEADPVGLLVHFLAMVGNLTGAGPHFEVEGAEHPARINLIVVGETGRGRKRTAYNRVREVLCLVDPDWDRDCTKGGLASGEGLVWAVRDRIMQRQKPKGRDGGSAGYQEVEIDAGVEDKRLLLLEEEFAQVLTVAERPGNTVSVQIRRAWDTGNISILTKNAPARATGAHVSVVGHITPDELERRLNTTEIANGLANRFLMVLVRRSQILPHGGDMGRSELDGFAHRLRVTIEAARKIGRVQFDVEARSAWERVYPDLSEGAPGLFGALTSRAEAQVLRLAVAYALLEASEIIRLPHLLAALALWEYAQASASYLFGQRLGDPDAELILEALRNNPDGLTRTQIRDLFDRHAPEPRIERALGVLLARNLAAKRLKPTPGRAAEVWVLRLATNTTEATEGRS
jgi:hypothetical protein